MHVERLEEHSIELDSKLNSKDKAVEDKIMEDSESSSSFLCFLNFTRASYQSLTTKAYPDAYWNYD